MGRGLAALIGEANEEAIGLDRAQNQGQRRAPVEFLRPNPRNPRKTFADASLDELADSIREKGILQPIVVREYPGETGQFEIVAGERRWRAAQRASLHSVPIVVIEATDKESLELAIIENVQRSDLNAIEEADGYAHLMREFGYTQADLGRIIGKSRSHVANTLRLANLPDTVKKLVADGSLTAGHARALLPLSDPEPVAKRILAQGLSVRDAERIAQEQLNPGPAKSERIPAKLEIKSADTVALEKSLRDATGLLVDVVHRGEGGEIRIQYKSIEQLDTLCRRITGGVGRAAG